MSQEELSQAPLDIAVRQICPSGTTEPKQLFVGAPGWGPPLGGRMGTTTLRYGHSPQTPTEWFQRYAAKLKIHSIQSAPSMSILKAFDLSFGYGLKLAASSQEHIRRRAPYSE